LPRCAASVLATVARSSDRRGGAGAVAQSWVLTPQPAARQLAAAVPDCLNHQRDRGSGRPPTAARTAAPRWFPTCGAASIFTDQLQTHSRIQKPRRFYQRQPHTQMLRADSISHLVTCCCCGYMLLWLHCGGFVWRHVRSVESSAAGDGWSRRERGRGRLEVVGRWSPQIPAPREPLVDCAFS
jgi:hypothetical protein